MRFGRTLHGVGGRLERWLGHLERLGGVLVAPRATFRRLLRTDEGRFSAILLWMVLFYVSIEPERVGRALLVARVDGLAGVFLFLNGLGQRFAAPLAGVVAAAVILHRVARSPSVHLPLDRALDLVSYALVPYLFLGASGVILASLGLETGVLPHRPIRGSPALVAARLVAAYGGSLILFGILLFEARREARTERLEPSPEAPSE